MKPRKIPMRMCVVTRELFEKRELVRVVKTPEGEFIVDETGKSNGRGAYLKRDLEVFKEARKKKLLNKVFQTEVSESIYDELEKII